MSEEDIRFKREVLGVSGLLVLGSMLIVLPFLDAIILAVATSYLLRFGHKKLNKKLENELLSSIVITSSIIGIIVLGVYLFVNNFDHLIAALQFFAIDLQQNINNVVQTLNLPEAYNEHTGRVIRQMVNMIQDWLRSTLASIPSLLIDVGIYLVTAIYIYRDGEKIRDKIFNIVESLPENEEKIIRSLLRSTDSIFRGVFITQFLVALLIGMMAGLGFYLIGILTTPIPFTVFLAILIGIAALLPIVAAFMFYGPIGGFYLVTGEPVKGTLILGFGVMFLNLFPEIFLRPYVGSYQMDEHPLIIFIGFLAGPLTLGLKGLVLGPVILILSKEFILNYSELVSDDIPQNRTGNS